MRPEHIADSESTDRDGASASAAPDSGERTEATTGLERRAFLKLAGFTLGGAALSGCTRGTEEKLIPYLVRPEEITPGRSYWYASTCGGCTAGCGLLAKNRDGRPIKLEGLPGHPVSDGGLCAVGQASVLAPYDSLRLDRPLLSGNPSDWTQVDTEVANRLQRVRESGGGVRVLSRTITSPTLRNTVEEFLQSFGNGKLVEYDPLSASAFLDAQAEAYGVRALPRLHFERAQTIVAFDADFLGTWVSPVEFTAAYQSGRRLAGADSSMSYHAQIESRLSITGSNADDRWTLRPSEIPLAVARLAAAVAERANVRPPWQEVGTASLPEEVISSLAERLWRTERGRSLVVCGTNDRQTQQLTAWINHTLGNSGAPDAETTIDLHRPSLQLRGDDRALEQLLEELRGGSVAALLIHDVNPVYDFPTANLPALLAKLELVVSFAERLDETTPSARFVCPPPHFLESWGDVEVVDGVVALAQPTLRPPGATRSAAESLRRWNNQELSQREILQAYWRDHVLPRSRFGANFEQLWDTALQEGYVEVTASATAPTAYEMPTLGAAPTAPTTTSPEILLYPKIGMRDGRHAHNAWLQELPDPITKIAWDNYASISPELAQTLGVETGDVLRLELPPKEGSVPLEVPAFIQPGQDGATVAVALGYGCLGTDRFADVGPRWLEARPTVAAGATVGVNAAAFLSFANGALNYGGTPVSIGSVGKSVSLATTQPYDSLSAPSHLRPPAEHGPRPIAQETTLSEYRKDPSAGGHAGHPLSSLYPKEHRYEGHHWAMAVDLSRCTGCSACVIGCQAENNVPVVGKDEVLRNREMSWIRIDRYYEAKGDSLKVVHQPMMCQHCDNAPCENVCPVLATLHSAEGLNQQVYNRCVGTRYCANNCPYKTRRFNWFDYPREDKLGNMVLNPDVTVRSRGVMEKCSFCVQRIQEAKAEAKREGRELADGDVQPACVQSCPANALVFGDRNDPESAIAKQRADPRHYHALEELNVLPSVGYLRKVRNHERGTPDHG